MGSRRTLTLASPKTGAGTRGTITVHAVVAGSGASELLMHVRGAALRSPRLFGTPSPFLAVHRVDPHDGVCAGY